MGLHHIYFDTDEKTKIEDAKQELLQLRAGGDEDAKQELIHQYQVPRRETKNIAERVLLDEPLDPQMLDTLARSVALGNRLEDTYKKSFEELLHGEHQRRKKHLSYVNSYMQSAGYDGFKEEDDKESLFVKMGVGNGRVLLSSPIIMPFHAPDHICWNHDKENLGLKLLSFGRANPIEKFHSRLALFGISVNNNSGESQVCAIPLILIDREVMNAVQSLMQSNDEAVKIAATRVLPGLQSLIPFGMHDYVHQMILANTDPQTKNLRLSGDNAPLKDFRKEERESMFQNNHQFKPDPKHEKFPGENNINMMANAYELHAELLNRDLWHESFRRTSKDGKPSPMKITAVRIATQFISDLETVRGALAKGKGEDFANRVAGLLSTIAISRFFRVMDVDDKILDQPIKLRNGTEDSFIGACEKLTLNPVTLDQGDAKRWLESMQLNDALKPEVAKEVAIETPKLLQVFAENSGRFPNLGRMLAMGQADTEIKDTLHPSGFENVVTRAFGGTGPMLNTPALMYNFPEGDGPILSTAKLLNDNRQVMGDAPIPAAFHEAMTQYHAAATRQLGGDKDAPGIS